jgi:ADP-heptose:LPS heptosyltransferase
MAAAINTPTVCVSNGERFKRFSPYPLSMTDKILTIYPDEAFYDKDNYDFLVKQYQYKSELNINDIMPETVFGAVKLKLEDFKHD